MKTLDRNRTMEHKEYSTTILDLPQYLKRLRVPQRAIVHFWYETPTDKVMPQKTENWKEKLKGIAGIWADYDNAQEISQDIRASFNNRISQ